MSIKFELKASMCHVCNVFFLFLLSDSPTSTHRKEKANDQFYDQELENSFFGSAIKITTDLAKNTNRAPNLKTKEPHILTKLISCVICTTFLLNFVSFFRLITPFSKKSNFSQLLIFSHLLLTVNRKYRNCCVHKFQELFPALATRVCVVTLCRTISLSRAHSISIFVCASLSRFPV